MKKILILAIGFGGGGAGKMCAVLENFLNKYYATKTLIFDKDRGIFQLKGKKVNIVCFKKSFPGRGYIELIPHIVNTIKYIYKEKPDIVIGNGAYCSFLGLVARKVFKFKLLLIQHEHITSGKKNMPMFSIYKIIYFLTKRLIGNTKIVCVSNDVKLDTIKYYGIKENQAKTIYNGLDFDMIYKLGNEKLSIDDKYIINIGGLNIGKNQELLIKAYSKSRIKEKYKLLLLGEGFMEGQLKDLCKNLNIQDSVIFAGFNKNPYKYLKNASLFCFTSKTEALPTVLIESLILDIPIITVPVIGSNEILMNGKFGIITEDYDESTLIKELDMFLEGGNRIKNNERLEYINNNFSIKSMEQKYIRIISDL